MQMVSFYLIKCKELQYIIILHDMDRRIKRESSESLEQSRCCKQ